MNPEYAFRLAVFILLLLTALAAFAWSGYRLILKLSIGKPESRFDNPRRRLKRVLTIAFAQSKLLRDPVAGLMHFFIFWGFMILLTAVVEAIIQGFQPSFSLQVLGPLYPALAAAQETIGGLVILSCIFALLRWYLFPPKRYYGREITGHVRLDATLILGLILTIMVSMFGVNAAGILLAGEPDPVRYISTLFSKYLSGLPDVRPWHEAFWWSHLIVILGFLNYLPYSKHLHVLTSIPNVYFASLRPRGELAPLNFEDETAESFGAADVEDLTWKQLLDGYTCTDCGRCTAACPASITGKPLSPRKIIMNVRERTSELAPLVIAGKKEVRSDLADHRLLDSFIEEQELWDCTTCRACMQECPVMIEHVPVIMEMRRYLVLTESRFPQELTQAFRSLENSNNPWGFSPDSREDWTKGLDVPVMARADGQPEILYWVGCAGSYDARYQKVSKAMVRLLKAANVRFAILGNEEKCNGDPARRSGNEYLAQMLISENVATLNRYNVRRIVATCPHCFNTLKNEYQRFGGDFEVLHHTELLKQLIDSGRLRLAQPIPQRVAFHDSCYIGRYNGIYQIPRDFIAHSGAAPMEVKRSRDRGLCCGAGGARMFMEEKIGKRINIERTEELLALGPGVIATECPFCMTMLSDGVKAGNADDCVEVRDVAEILADCL